MKKKRVLVIGSYIYSLINFRKDLLEDLVKKEYEVLAIAPGFDQETVDHLLQIGVRYQPIELSRTGLNLFNDTRFIVALTKLIRSYKPDVLITYTIKPVIYGNLVGSFFRKVKKIALITGLGYLDTDTGSLKKGIIRTGIHALYKISIRNVEFVAFQNPDDRDYFTIHRLLGRSTQTMITAGSGVNLTHYHRATPVVHPITFLFIARLIRAKGIVQYLEASRNLRRMHGSKIVCRIIGLPDPDNLDSINNEILQPYIDDNSIEYLGYQKDVRPWLAASSVFVLPSYYREGTPRTALEALAMAKPIITTDNPGCRETVVDKENGFLIPIKNVGTLTTAMNRFIVNPSLIEEMGQASYRLAVNKFDVDLVNKSIFEFTSL